MTSSQRLFYHQSMILVGVRRICSAHHDHHNYKLMIILTTKWKCGSWVWSKDVWQLRAWHWRPADTFQTYVNRPSSWVWIMQWICSAQDDHHYNKMMIKTIWCPWGSYVWSYYIVDVRVILSVILISSRNNKRTCSWVWIMQWICSAQDDYRYNKMMIKTIWCPWGSYVWSYYIL